MTSFVCMHVCIVHVLKGQSTVCTHSMCLLLVSLHSLPHPKPRLLSMRLDIDDHTAICAINVLEQMQIRNLLDGEDCQEVCELIFLENRGISHAAGQFAVSYLFSEDFMSKAKLRKIPRGIHNIILS